MDELVRRERDPDTGEIYYGEGFWSNLVSKLTSKTAKN